MAQREEKGMEGKGRESEKNITHITKHKTSKGKAISMRSEIPYPIPQAYYTPKNTDNS